MKKLIFFAIASAILLFSIIVINIAPAINGLVEGKDWSARSCKYLSNIYDENKKNQASDETLKSIKNWLNRCNRRQAMVGLEYVVSNLNIIFGFICALLGFLLFINVGNMGKYTGLIGLGVGFVGFVLTFVYVIESGLVFDDIDFDLWDIWGGLGTSFNEDEHVRIDSDGAHLEWNGNKYTCIFYKKDDEYSTSLRYSDYGNKYLSYNKDLNVLEGDNEFIFREHDFSPIQSGGCIYTSIDNWSDCKKLDEGTSFTQLLNLNSKIKYYDDEGHSKGDCDKLYFIDMNNLPTTNEKKILYDRWLTTLIFSCFIFLLNIGLAIFGFLLFRESGGSSGPVAIK